MNKRKNLKRKFKGRRSNFGKMARVVGALCLLGAGKGETVKKLVRSAVEVGLEPN